MVNKLTIVESSSFHPYYNQAVEASLFDMADEETMTLYIWANDKTVFIGKNQNAYTECNVQKLRENGGYLARRLSGGGAVYHDKGNLNFTFVCTKNNYSIAENFAVLLDAVNSFGISAQISGRNDCTIEGKKFSGNAFYASKDKRFHHGTVLINTHSAEIAKYLNVSPVKLNARGVSSVVSRVTNLNEYDSSIDYKSFSAALKECFTGHWKNTAVSVLDIKDISPALMKNRLDFFSDERRVMGDNIEFNFQTVRRFDWGTADIRLQLKNNIIEKGKIYTDSLEHDITAKENMLIGKNIYLHEDDAVSDIISAVKECMG